MEMQEQQAVTQGTPLPPFDPKSAAKLTRRLNKLKEGCRELGITIRDLEEMAGYRRGLTKQWEYRIAGTKKGGQYVTTVRNSTWYALEKTLADLRGKKDKEDLAKQYAQRTQREEGKPMQPVSLGVAQVVQRLYDDEKPNGEDKAPAPAPQAKVDEKWIVPPEGPTEQPTAREVIRGLVVSRLDALTFLELAQLLAHLEGARK